MLSTILTSIILGNVIVITPAEVREYRLDNYLERLHQFECQNCPQNFSKIDNDGERVYSCLQFKESTFREQVKKFNLLPEAENADIMNMIYDCHFQKRLAKMMLEENPRFIWRWKVSVKRGLGLPPNYD